MSCLHHPSVDFARTSTIPPWSLVQKISVPRHPTFTWVVSSKVGGSRDSPQNLWWIRASYKQQYIGAMSHVQFFQMVYVTWWEIIDWIELIIDTSIESFILRVLLSWSALRSSEGWTCCGILHQGQSMGHWEWLISKSGCFVCADFVQEMHLMRLYYHHYEWLYLNTCIYDIIWYCVMCCNLCIQIYWILFSSSPSSPLVTYSQ